MVAPHGNIAQRTSQAESITNRDFRNIRRPRHAHDASTDASAALTSVSPYAEILRISHDPMTEQPNIAIRGGMRSGWGASQKPKPPSQAKRSSDFRVTPGDLGTHAIHPPGKRSIDINKSHFHTETRGRAQRPAPTRRICFRKSHMGSKTNIGI